MYNVKQKDTSTKMYKKCIHHLKFDLVNNMKYKITEYKI